MGLAVWVFASFASAQASPGPSHPQQHKDKASEIAQPAQRPAVPRVPLMYGEQVQEQTLTQPPEVSWDGKQLTIDTENSTLTDVLLAVRAKTGASVEIPPSAANEKVALHIGPAPVREVISTLLYGTNFDYVVQAADDDPDGLRSVIVTLRGKGEDMVAGETTTTVPTGPGVRMMRGYAAPGKPAYQAAAEAALAEQPSSDNSAAPADSASAAPETAPAQDPAAPAAAESASANSPAANTDPNAAPAATADASSMSTTDISPVTTRASTAITSSSDAGSEGAMSHMVQDLQRMYQQRQQIQAQQNQQNQAKQPAAN